MKKRATPVQSGRDAGTEPRKEPSRAKTSRSSRRSAPERAAPRRATKRVADSGLQLPVFRVGHGFDTHRLEAGQGVTLGGVRIACPYRIVAHSDGDVLIHALCDALLGAIAGGDIGRLFPDSDPQFRGIDSRRLLAEVMRRVHASGYAVMNADLSLIAEAPRVAQHVPEMCAALAAELGVATDRVNVKATTNEGMDAIGRREALAAHAVVLLQPQA